MLDRVPQIQLLVCAGAAGALSNQLNIGDVVVAPETVEHDYNLKSVNRPLPRFTGDCRGIAVLQNLPQHLSPLLSQQNSAFSIHFGAVASGDEDIVDAVRGQALINLIDCIAVAWEGAGGARACKFNEKDYIELRGVTDTANYQAAADFEVNLVTAMHNLAEVIVQSRFLYR